MQPTNNEEAFERFVRTRLQTAIAEYHQGGSERRHDTNEQFHD